MIPGDDIAAAAAALLDLLFLKQTSPNWRWNLERSHRDSRVDYRFSVCGRVAGVGVGSILISSSTRATVQDLVADAILGLRKISRRHDRVVTKRRDRSHDRISRKRARTGSRRLIRMRNVHLPDPRSSVEPPARAPFLETNSVYAVWWTV